MRVKGVVKWFNDAKGFGFIQQEKGPDVFVHFTAIDTPGFRTLNEGDIVFFDVAQGPKCLQASNVRKEIDENWNGFGDLLKTQPISFRLAFRKFLKDINLNNCSLGRFLTKNLPGPETCAKCYFENPSAHKYCGMCGHNLAEFTPKN